MALGLRLLGLYILVDLVIRIPQLMTFVLVYVREGGGGFPGVTPGQIVALTIGGFALKTALALLLGGLMVRHAAWLTDSVTAAQEIDTG